MPDYHTMLENVLATEEQCTTEISRLSVVREQARGQIALLRHLIAIEANDAHLSTHRSDPPGPVLPTGWGTDHAHPNPNPDPDATA